jgi:hypothetical protein
MSRLLLERVGAVPAIEFRARQDGTIEFRYLVEDDNYQGFEGAWRVMSEGEQRDHFRLGGKIADWLKTIKQNNGGQ